VNFSDDSYERWIVFRGYSDRVRRLPAVERSSADGNVYDRIPEPVRMVSEPETGVRIERERAANVDGFGFFT